MSTKKTETGNTVEEKVEETKIDKNASDVIKDFATAIAQEVTKANTKEATPEELEDKVVSEAVKAAVNANVERVRIKLPKERKGEENFVIVSVNCKSYQIQKGVWVDVPVFVAEVLDNAERAEIEADRYIEQNVE